MKMLNVIAVLGLVSAPLYSQPTGFISPASAGPLFLPPAGQDFFPAVKAEFILFLGNADPLTIHCAGPMTFDRGDPAAAGDGTTQVETEIIALDLSCSGGVEIRVDPNSQSAGATNEHGASFFDLSVELDYPPPAGFAETMFFKAFGIQMQATLGHIPPIGSVYFGARTGRLLKRDTDQSAGALSLIKLNLNGVSKPESRGEFSTVFSCFYECKWEREGKQMGLWQQITTLMLVNPSARQTVQADILFTDGNENPVAWTKTELSPLDLDEINVCASLDDGAGAAVPSAGVIEVILSPTGGVYGWVKNVLGHFERFEPDPFKGSPTGIAKTQCRVVGPNAATPRQIRQELDSKRVREIRPILIEGTAE